MFLDFSNAFSTLPLPGLLDKFVATNPPIGWRNGSQSIPSGKNYVVTPLSFIISDVVAVVANRYSAFA